MTQRTLIERLRKVEEALGTLVGWGRHYGSHSEKQCEAALADLRELIKEVEHVHLLGEARESGVVWYGLNPHGWPTGTTFYALGEKP